MVGDDAWSPGLVFPGLCCDGSAAFSSLFSLGGRGVENFLGNIVFSYRVAVGIARLLGFVFFLFWVGLFCLGKAHWILFLFDGFCVCVFCEFKNSIWRRSEWESSRSGSFGNLEIGRTRACFGRTTALKKKKKETKKKGFFV